jgi:polar amino acid transport system substrate-binding protein
MFAVKKASFARVSIVSCLWLIGTLSLSASDMADVKARGKVVMLCSPHPRSDFIRRDGDGYFGLDCEILKTFAAFHEIRLEVEPVPKFSDLIPWLLEGKGDVIASSFSINQERRREVDFSESYFPVRVMVVAVKGSSIAGESDLPGLRAAVVPGSSLEAFIREKVPDVDLVHVEQTPLVYDAIVTGKSDYAPVDSTAALTYLKSFSDLETVFSFSDRFGYGFAVSKGSDISEALSQHVERLRSTGVYYKMLQRTLGPEAVEVVKAAESEK